MADVPVKGSFIKRLFCKHDYKTYEVIEQYMIISGSKFREVCCKCGKVRKEYFLQYNDDGTGYR